MYLNPLLFRTDGKILRDYLCVVAEQIEDTENFKIVVNVCDEKSNWTYTEVTLPSIVNYAMKHISRLISCAGLTLTYV